MMREKRETEWRAAQMEQALTQGVKGGKLYDGRHVVKVTYSLMATDMGTEHVHATRTNTTSASETTPTVPNTNYPNSAVVLNLCDPVPTRTVGDKTEVLGTGDSISKADESKTGNKKPATRNERKQRTQ
jgi:hypothetical protein